MKVDLGLELQAVTVSLSPSSISQHLMPSKCSRRVWLKANSPELERVQIDPFDQFLQDQGIRHEERLLVELREKYLDWSDIGGRDNPDAFEDTVLLIEEEKGLIYQGLLVKERVALGDQEVSIIGYPDFMIHFDGGYEISDAKLARAIYETNHNGERKLKPKRLYIELQLQLYGWLFQELFPEQEVRLTVRNGKQEVEEVSLDQEGSSLEALASLLKIRSQTEEPWEPVGWSKCQSCSFREHCWPRAEEERETGMVPDLDQRLCKKLRNAEGIETYPDLLERMTARELASIKNKSAGPEDPDNLVRAQWILENALALEQEAPLIRTSSSSVHDSDLELLSDSSYVMFDLEGVPPDIDQDWDKIYLWGLQVFGANAGDFYAASAGFGEGGDEEGWVEFLAVARSILDENPGIRFVHWAPYEKTKLTQYTRRYPHTDVETAEKVKDLLLDLHPVTKRLVALPLPSYSLKVVEQLPALAEATGFSRGAKEIQSGDASIAAYMEAVETEDLARREELVEQVVAYNREDLEATWAVLKWLQGLLSIEC